VIPEVGHCLELMDRYRMLPNIREHSLLVGRTAGVIGCGLKQAGVAVDPALAIAGGLLHDIAKSLCLSADSKHAEEGARICRELGFPKVAEIVAEHVFLARDMAPDLILEKEIVYYADKRVLHNRLVDIRTRRDDIIQRYGKGDPTVAEAIRANFEICRAVEEKIFRHLPFAPEDLEEQVHGFVLEESFMGCDRG